MTNLILHPGEMGWCPQANGGKGSVVGPLVPTGDMLYFDGCFTDTFGSMWWSDGSPRTVHPFGPITTIAAHLSADAPFGSRWQCVRGNWLGHTITIGSPGFLAEPVSKFDLLFIRLPDAASKETAMAHFADLTAINCPLGELDDDTYAQLMVAWRNGGGIEYWSTLFGEWCSTIGPEWDPETKYRLAATTATPDFIPWGTVHRDFNFHARDADGQRHFFAIRPDIGETRWKLQGNKVVSSAATAGIIIGDKLWDQSMVCRPRWEGK